MLKVSRGQMRLGRESKDCCTFPGTTTLKGTEVLPLEKWDMGPPPGKGHGFLQGATNAWGSYLGLNDGPKGLLCL